MVTRLVRACIREPLGGAHLMGSLCAGVPHLRDPEVTDHAASPIRPFRGYRTGERSVLDSGDRRGLERLLDKLATPPRDWRYSVSVSVDMVSSPAMTSSESLLMNMLRFRA
jgi:hypothetical protein